MLGLLSTPFDVFQLDANAYSSNVTVHTPL